MDNIFVFYSSFVKQLNLFIFLVVADESSNDSNHSMVWVDRSTSPSPTPNESNQLGQLGQ